MTIYSHRDQYQEVVEVPACMQACPSDQVRHPPEKDKQPSFNLISKKKEKHKQEIEGKSLIQDKIEIP